MKFSGSFSYILFVIILALLINNDAKSEPYSKYKTYEYKTKNNITFIVEVKDEIVLRSKGASKDINYTLSGKLIKNVLVADINKDKLDEIYIVSEVSTDSLVLNSFTITKDKDIQDIKFDIENIKGEISIIDTTLVLITNSNFKKDERSINNKQLEKFVLSNEDDVYSLVKIQNEQDYYTNNNICFLLVENIYNNSCEVEIRLKSSGAEKNIDTLVDDGRIYSDIIVTDLNKDGYDEIYIETTACGSVGYVNLTAYTITPSGEIKNINTDSINGEFGHDRSYSVINDSDIVKKQPIYEDNGTHCCPTGEFYEKKFVLGLINDDYRLIEIGSKKVK